MGLKYGFIFKIRALRLGLRLNTGFVFGEFLSLISQIIGFLFLKFNNSEG